MRSPLQFLDGLEYQFLSESEKKEDLATGADLILQYRGTQTREGVEDEELVLVYGLLCFLLIGGPRKHRPYRNKASDLRETFLRGISVDRDKREIFLAACRPKLKELHSGEPLVLDDFDELFDSETLGLGVQDHLELTIPNPFQHRTGSGAAAESLLELKILIPFRFRHR